MKAKIEIRCVRIYARSCLSILVYWLVIKLRSCFWKHGESYDKTPDFVWKILFFFSKPDLFFCSAVSKKNERYMSWEERVPLRVEAGKREKRGYLPTGELSVADRILSPPSTAERRRRTVGAQRLSLMTPFPSTGKGMHAIFPRLKIKLFLPRRKRLQTNYFP